MATVTREREALIAQLHRRSGSCNGYDPADVSASCSERWSEASQWCDNCLLRAAAAALASAPPAAPTEDARDKPAKADVWHLHAYVGDHAADHDDECPGDDTCDCSFKARNDAVNRCVRWLIEHPSPASAAPPEDARKECGTCVHRGEVTGSCMLDVLDPQGEELPDAPFKNWRNRETFSCGAWEALTAASATPPDPPRVATTARQSDPPGLVALMLTWRARLADLNAALRERNDSIGTDGSPCEKADHRAITAIRNEEDARVAVLAYDMTAPAPMPRGTCPECGPVTGWDEDGCCRTCGHDVPEAHAPAPLPTKEQPCEGQIEEGGLFLCQRCGPGHIERCPRRPTHERVERAIESLVPGEVITLPPHGRFTTPKLGAHWLRPVQVQAMPDGSLCRMGHRIAVRNCHTGRLSYIDAVTLQRAKDRAASPTQEGK